jgi:hypothetical protein
MSSKEYCLAPPQDRTAMFSGRFIGGIDFDDKGEFATVSFRLPVNVLRRLLFHPSRFISITSMEIRDLLRAVRNNKEEPTELRVAAANVLGRR